jgi:hypothetical protein
MNLPDHPSYLLRMLQGRLKRLATQSPCSPLPSAPTPTAAAARLVGVTTAAPCTPAST